MSFTFSNVHSVLFSILLSSHIDDDGGDRWSKTVPAVYIWWSFGLADSCIYCFFANESLHHRNTDRVHQRDGASVWAALTAPSSLALRTSRLLASFSALIFHLLYSVSLNLKKIAQFCSIFRAIHDYSNAISRNLQMFAFKLFCEFGKVVSNSLQIPYKLRRKKCGHFTFTNLI